MRAVRPSIAGSAALAAAVLAASAALACADPDRFGPPLAERLVGPDGGVLEGGGARLEIPRGAVDAQVLVSIRLADVDEDVGFDRVSAIHRFTPEDLALALPATVTIPLAGAAPGAVLFWRSPGDPGYAAVETAHAPGAVSTTTRRLGRGFAAISR
jgi:hypothetical protein